VAIGAVGQRQHDVRPRLAREGGRRSRRKLAGHPTPGGLGAPGRPRAFLRSSRAGSPLAARAGTAAAGAVGSGSPTRDEAAVAGFLAVMQEDPEVRAGGA
jgi:hypothetical protein